MKREFHYSIYKCPPPAPTFSQINPVFPNIQLYITLPSATGFPEVFPPKAGIHFSSPQLTVTCPAHLVLLYFITRKTYGE
jgi:hypothetical protein